MVGVARTHRPGFERRSVGPYNAPPMNNSGPRSRDSVGLDPQFLGTLLSLVSAGLYTGTNICMRYAVAHHVVWVTLLKTAPTIVVAGAALVLAHGRGQRYEVAPRTIGVLTVAALIAHWGGNVSFQYAMSTIGLALTVPLCFAALMFSGAVQGQCLLGERVSGASIMGMLALVAAIGLLSVDATGPQSGAGSPSVVLGAVAAVVSGAAFSVLGTAMRWSVSQRVPPAVAVMTTGVAGVVTLGAASVALVGPEELAATPVLDVGVMLAGGAFNAIAFLILGRAFQLAPVVQVNAANASQTAMAAVAGVLLFHEPASLRLALGIALTLAALALVQQRPRGRAT